MARSYYYRVHRIVFANLLTITIFTVTMHCKLISITCQSQSMAPKRLAPKHVEPWIRCVISLSFVTHVLWLNRTS